MPYNRIAVYGHRGWASSAIVESLAASGAPIKVFYRAGSDVSHLPSNITQIEVDVEDQSALVAALHDIDIVIALVGHEGVKRQHNLVKAIPHTNVKLFVPSDLAARYDEQGLRIPVNESKDEVERAAKRANIPTTVVLPGNFAEFALNTLAMGVDYAGNRVLFTGDSRDKMLNLCTRQYVGAAYASLFASTPISELQNRTIGITELRPTGNEIASALEKKHGTAPLTIKQSLEQVDAEIESCLRASSPFALAWYCRKIWGTGQQADMIGGDVWEVKDYAKATLQDLIVEGRLEAYREMPPQVPAYFNATFK